jgi:DNA repair protein RecN (Recombination protein N)
LKADLAEVESRIASVARDRDYNAAQLRQLDAASLSLGELECLEEEQKQLANAEEIKNGLCAVEHLFMPASDTEMMPVDALLKEIDRLLAKVGRYVPAAGQLAQRVLSCRRELDDVYSEVCDINSKMDMSADRLEEVESRMSLIYSLMHKHGCANEAELIAFRDRLSSEFCDSSRLEELADELRHKITATSVQLQNVADELRTSRQKESYAFAQNIQNSVRSLELPYALFQVELSEAPLSQTGSDAVAFLFTSTGKNPVEVSKCASGGEMSRIMLSLKAMMARFSQMPTMVFDEIDTGVSGSVADKMGSMICDMGQHMQVFAITHLPQVAAKGSAHYLVEKQVDPAKGAVSTISRLSDEDRVYELARMLSGSVLTPQAVENAKSLLQ